MKARLKRAAVVVIGWAFLLLGVAGLFLPVLQGVLFIVIGLLILSTEYVWAHRLLQKLRARFPSISAKADEAAHKAHRWLERIWHGKKAASAEKKQETSEPVGKR